MDGHTCLFERVRERLCGADRVQDRVRDDERAPLAHLLDLVYRGGERARAHDGDRGRVVVIARAGGGVVVPGTVRALGTGTKGLGRRKTWAYFLDLYFFWEVIVI
jgi:hypothetical protein